MHFDRQNAAFNGKNLLPVILRYKVLSILNNKQNADYQIINKYLIVYKSPTVHQNKQG